VEGLRLGSLSWCSKQKEDWAGLWLCTVDSILLIPLECHTSLCDNVQGRFAVPQTYANSSFKMILNRLKAEEGVK
jgi:hypothetical protein